MGGLRVPWQLGGRQLELTQEQNQCLVRLDRSEFVLYMQQPGEQAGAHDSGLLCLHAENGEIALVQYLVDVCRTNLNIETTHGKAAGTRRTPLAAAAKAGKTQVVQFLCQRSADINEPTDAGFTPLSLASYKGFADCVQVLCASRADVNRATEKQALCATPLYFAAQEGHKQVCQLLLQAGADKFKTNLDGCTPMDIAEDEGHGEVAELLEAWVDKTGLPPLALVRVKALTKCEDGTMIPAGRAGVIVKSDERGEGYLVEFGEEKEEQKWVSRDVAKASFELAEAVYDASSAQLAFFGACKAGVVGAMRVAEVHGADLNAAMPSSPPTQDSGLTGLHLAAKENHVKALQYLIKKNAALDQATPKGFTALGFLAYSNKPTSVQLLLTAGADPNAGTVTPLWLAAQNGLRDVVEVLIRSGADVSADVNGMTPAKIAADKGHHQVAEMIQKAEG